MTERALVLGGGGANGNAWIIGVIAGLFDAGLDVTKADSVIGTSAGATAAAQITGTTKPSKLFYDILAQSLRRGRREGGIGRAAGPRPVANHMERTEAIFSAAKNVADLRRRIVAAALELEARSDGSAQERWRAIVAARLPNRLWPQRRLLITAIEGGTGELVTFDHQSGVDLIDAVAASTSNGFGVPPYRIRDQWYIDGGYPSSVNAMLAGKHKRILVLSPFGDRSRAPHQWGIHLSAQVDELRVSGSNVETICPDSNSRDAFGIDMMDVSARPLSAQAGFNQGKGLAARLTHFWR